MRTTRCRDVVPPSPLFVPWPRGDLAAPSKYAQGWGPGTTPPPAGHGHSTAESPPDAAKTLQITFRLSAQPLHSPVQQTLQPRHVGSAPLPLCSPGGAQPLTTGHGWHIAANPAPGAAPPRARRAPHLGAVRAGGCAGHLGGGALALSRALALRHPPRLTLAHQPRLVRRGRHRAAAAPAAPRRAAEVEGRRTPRQVDRK